MMDRDLDRQGLLESARAIRPYLPDLVGPAAGQLDQQIAELLAAAGRGEDITATLQTVLHDDETTADFVAEVLADAPRYRPPDRQPDTLRGHGMHPLPGDIAPVLHAGKYTCPQGDYVWYRPAVRVPVPPCPTHGPALTRA